MIGYKEKILHMLEEIEDESILKLIYHILLRLK